MPRRIGVAEDSMLMREALQALLSRFGYDIVAMVPDSALIEGAVAEHRPDLLITDVRMPPGNTDDGLRAAVSRRERDPRLPVLVLSRYVEQSYAAKLLGSGGGRGVGYLLKDRVGAVERFADAVEQVASVGRSSIPRWSGSCFGATTIR